MHWVHSTWCFLPPYSDIWMHWLTILQSTRQANSWSFSYLTILGVIVSSYLLFISTLMVFSFVFTFWVDYLSVSHEMGSVSMTCNGDHDFKLLYMKVSAEMRKHFSHLYIWTSKNLLNDICTMSDRLSSEGKEGKARGSRGYNRTIFALCLDVYFWTWYIRKRAYLV